MSLLEHIQTLSLLAEEAPSKKTKAKTKAKGEKSFKPKRVWPDRLSVDYWRTMRDGLKVGFQGKEKERAGTPVAGPSTWIGINSPLSKKFKDSLPKGSLQAKAADKPGMTMGALRFISNVFGDKDAEVMVKEAEKVMKDTGAKIQGDYNTELYATGKDVAGRMIQAKYPSGEKKAAFDNMLGHCKSQYGTTSAEGVRMVNLLVQHYGVGGTLIGSAQANQSDKLVDADGKINLKRVVRGFGGPLYRDGKKVPAKSWTDDDLKEAEDNVKEFLGMLYASNVAALRRVDKSKALTGVAGFVRDGQVMMTRGIGGFSATGGQLPDATRKEASRSDPKLTAICSAKAMKYDMGVLTNQRPISGYSIGAGNASATYGYKGPKKSPDSDYSGGSDKVTVRTVVPIEAILYSCFSAYSSYRQEAEVMVMGTTETPVKICKLKTNVISELGPQGSEIYKEWLKSEKGGMDSLPLPKKDNAEELMDAFTPGPLPFKGRPIRDSFRVPSLDSLLEQLGAQS